MAQLKPRQVSEYHVFVASPGDMATERRAVREFFTMYNRTVARMVQKLRFPTSPGVAGTCACSPGAHLSRLTAQRRRAKLPIWVGQDRDRA